MRKPASQRPLSETSRHIVDAAGPIFARKGFHATTVREITREAKVNIAAVNYHFRDKHELYVSVLKHAHQAAARTAEANSAGTPEVKLRRFIRAFLGYLLDPHRPQWQGRLIALEMTQPTQALDRLVAESVLPLKKQLHGIVRDLVGSGVPMPETRINLACLSVVGQCLHYVHCREMIGRLFPTERHVHRDINTLAEHIFEFSLAGLIALRNKYKAGSKPSSVSPSSRKKSP